MHCYNICVCDRNVTPIPIRPNFIRVVNPTNIGNMINPQPNLQGSNNYIQGFNNISLHPQNFTQDQPQQNNLMHPIQTPLKQIQPRLSYRTLPQQQNRPILLQPQQPRQLFPKPHQWFSQPQQASAPRNVWRPLFRANRARTIRRQSLNRRNAPASDPEIINLITPPSSPTI